MPTKVTRDALTGRIDEVTYTILPNGRTTVCQLTMVNGFTVEGQSACVVASEFDEQEGQQYAYEDAIDKAWAFEGYLLAEKRWQQSWNLG